MNGTGVIRLKMNLGWSFPAADRAMQVNSEKKALLEPSEKTVERSDKKTERTAKSQMSQAAEPSSTKKVGKRLMPKKLTEDEFAKGPLGWVSTLLYLSMVWVIGLSFAIGMLFLNMTRLGEVPVYFGADSFIGNTPRIFFEPNPSRFNKSHKGVIQFLRNDLIEQSTHNLLVRYGQIIDEYNVPTYYNITEDGNVVGKEKRVFCSDFDGNKDGQPVNTSCLHDLSEKEYGPCALTKDNMKQNAMGFAEGSPCIMIRLTRLLGWFPSVPEVDAKSKRKCKKEAAAPYCCHRHRVAFNCTGASFEMFPKDGFHTCGYPFWNQPGFQTPFVMLKFNLTAGETEVTCKSNMQGNEDEEKNKLVLKFNMN